MKHLSTLLCLVALLASCGTTSKSTSGALHPDQVFTVTQGDIDRETWIVNSAIKGEWKYNGPSVDVSGRNLMAGIGKPIAKNKIKKKLKSAYQKMGLTRLKPEFAFNQDGTCAIQLLGKRLNGTYNYNPDLQKVTFKWHGIPLSARLTRSGSKKLHLTFDADKLLSLLSMASSLSDNAAIKEINRLVENYDDVMIGFELKK